MRFLVTGAGGFIGHNVVRLLEEQGHICLGIDTFTNYGFIPSDELEFLKTERTQRIKTKVVEVDIRNQQVMHDLIDAFLPDTLIHLASFPRQKVVLDNPIVGSDVMSTGLITLLDACAKKKVKKFVYISSSMVYGDFEQDFVTEDAVCAPQGQYGIMKYAGEKLVEDYGRRTGMQYTIIRPSAVYGEHDVNDRVVSKFMLAAMRGGTLKVRGAGEILDFTHVTDTANGIALAAANTNANGKTYNITRSSSQMLTLQGAAELIIGIVGRGDYEILDRDLNFPKRGRLSIDRARSDLGYDPVIDVDKGMKLYYNWLLSSSYWKTKLNDTVY